MSETIRFVGDVHGNIQEFKDLILSTPDTVNKIIQVGDLGIGFGQNSFWHEKLDIFFLKNRVRFIRGNHDNPFTCKNMRSWIPDGTIEQDIMYIGGAWSIDYYVRTEGLNWWKDEELSYSEGLRVLHEYKRNKPKVIVAHDCPLAVSKKLFVDRGLTFSKEQFQTRTGQLFDTMFEVHQPELWIMGHWHHDLEETIDGTKFICLNELSHIDIRI